MSTALSLIADNAVLFPDGPFGRVAKGTEAIASVVQDEMVGSAFPPDSLSRTYARAARSLNLCTHTV